MSKAQVIHQLGPPGCMRWQDWDVPDPGPGEVRLRHTAVGVNFADTYHRGGVSHPWPVPPCPVVIGFEGVGMGEPFLVTLKGATEAGDTFSRLLLAPPSPPEDPFTGSATGAMSAYLWHRGLMQKDQFIAEQGHWMDRPGQARVTRVGPPEAMTGIRVAGRGTIVMRGEVDMPDDESRD